ncbi:MAG: hypothetical protein DHS20C15_34110 [Planctomycetota bacterium]|nr:MAG: hypothetical protein DHS20C15_34110 [Planctomycetota bacterium]
MGGPLQIPLQILLAMAVAVFGIYLLIKLLVFLGWALGQFFGAIGNIFGRVGAFIGGEVSDVLRVIGGVITGSLFVPLTVANIALGRWSRANHYGRALEEEAVGVAQAVYRIGLGHPTKLLGLTHLTDGVERRLPEVIRRAPGPDLPRGRHDAFEGYTVTGSLPSGGSGARLFLAEPLSDKRTALSAQGVSLPPKVVIKSFSLGDGSTMPQIVRESRALHSARKLGLVLEHELSATRFHYVMPFVPGEDLSVVTQHLHAEAPAKGLADAQLRKVLGYMSDLVVIMQRFHAEGLWHKDIKPSNIIVSDGRVKLVDLGLITPLQSAMTLTTHGTEYFRDPELVRLALRGVKVNEVDGVKFDIYGAGAVFYSMIENSFPAHGSLSALNKRCPESVRWIIRRAMADMGKRYGTTEEMLRDLQAVMAAPKLEAFPPASLPSMGGEPADDKSPRKFFGLFAGPGRAGVNLDELDNELGDDATQHTSRGAENEVTAGAHAAVTSEHAASTAAAKAAWAKTARRRRRPRHHSDGNAASKRSGGVRGGVLVATGCFLFAIAGCTAFALLMPNFGEPLSIDLHSPSSVDHHAPPPRPADAFSLSARSLAQQAEQIAERFSPSAEAQGRADLARKQLLTAAKSLAKHRTSAVPQRVLVLDDAPVGLAGLAERALAPTLEGLALANFTLVALGQDHDLDDDEHARLESELRALIGVSDPGDPSVAKRIRAYLEVEPALSGVLWLGRGDDESTLDIEFQAVPESNQDDGVALLTLAARAY